MTSRVRQDRRPREDVVANPGAVAGIEALGLAFREAGEGIQARRWLLRALSAAPGRPQVEAALSLVCHQMGDWLGAGRHGRRALALDPARAEAAGNSAATLLELGESEGAVPWLRRAIAIAPQWFAPHGNLGNALRAKGLLVGARAAFRRSLSLAPQSAPVWANLAQAEQDLLRAEIADIDLRRALAIASHPAVHSNLVFLRTYRGDIDEGTLHATVRRWGRTFTRPMPRPAIRDPDPERRLRIGYVSADLRSHPVGWNLIGLIEQHDRSQVETFAYSAVTRVDDMTARFKRRFMHWREVAAMDDPRLAQQIATDRIDILVLVAGHTQANRLAVAGYRPAPLQVSIHDLTSTGVNAVDYWLTDATLSPPVSEEAFVETLARLPCFYLHMPPTPPDAISTGGAASTGPVVFGCCNNPAKLGDPVLKLWATVLKAVPGSLLSFRYFRHFAMEDGRAPLVAALERHGIDRSRLRFEAGQRDRDDQLRYLATIDIMLDPFPFNGATTTFEALWMGVPVVTLAGRRFVGRVAEAHLRQIGLDDLVAADEAAYVRIARALAANPLRRAELRRTLRGRVLRSPLCDAGAYARNVERAYREMWRAACAGRDWDGTLAPSKTS